MSKLTAYPSPQRARCPVPAGRKAAWLAVWAAALCLAGSACAQARQADGYLDAARGIDLGAQAQDALQLPAADGGDGGKLRYQKPAITPTGGGMGSGSAYFTSGVYTGKFKQLQNPYSGNRYWVLDEGTYEQADSVRYVGRFHYFHRDHKAASHYEEDWLLADAGRYFFVGTRIAADGSRAAGVYSAQADDRSLPVFMPADVGYLQAFERRYADQVRAFRQAQAGKQGDGLSFAQVLALGLGAAALSQAGLPGPQAVHIGGAFAADVMTAGQAGALPAVAPAGPVAKQGPYHPAATTDNAAKVATAQATSDHVTVSCPSGVTRSIPISYKTASCRTAMIEFARVYSCNLIDDFASVQAGCQAACGHPQCRQ